MELLEIHHEHCSDASTPTTVLIVPALIDSALSYKSPWLWSGDNRCCVAVPMLALLGWLNPEGV